MASIFLSHNRKDKPFVRELARYFKQYGIKVWVDEAEIKIGDSLINKVGEAIKKNAFVGVVISRHSVNSTWVEKELQIALQREFREKRVVVLPMLLDDSELPIFLSDKLYANFSAPERYYTELGKLLDTLGAHQKPGQRVYISYTHDSPEHKEWVAQLCRNLILDGKNVTFDYSFMQPGKDFWDSIFLELSRTQSVVLVVTPRYKLKTLGTQEGGLKREYDEILRLTGLRPEMKVIPVLRKGDWSVIPDEFSTRFAIDMRDNQPDSAYQQLLQALA